jgi:hypothetical protein
VLALTRLARIIIKNNSNKASYRIVLYSFLVDIVRADIAVRGPGVAGGSCTD